MRKTAVFYKCGVFGKQGPYQCTVLFNLGVFKIIRFSTLWDDSWYSYRTRVKFFWNVEELLK